jgi:hypothetical protein
MQCAVMKGPIMKRRVAIIAVAGLCAGASAQSYVESFEGGINAGGWTFGAPVEGIQPTGGLPGAYFRGSQLDTTIPFLRTGIGGSSPFVGNYRAARVSFVVASLKVFATDFPIGTRSPAVILYNDNGTPADPLDDWGAYSMSPESLAVVGEWGTCGFSVPSDQTVRPPGWTMIDFGPNVPPGRNWDTLTQDVDRLMISFGDPSLIYIFQMWDVGADQISIYTRSCYPNCDNSTALPCLNVNDFVCFSNAFVSGNTYANCDNSTFAPVLTVMDYICFMMSYAAGCAGPNCDPHR